MSPTELRESQVWADVHGSEHAVSGGGDSFENMDDGGVDLFGNMDSEFVEDMDHTSNGEMVGDVESSYSEHVGSSSSEHVESSYSGHVESSSSEHVESSSPEHVESPSLEHVESPSPEYVESSSPEHVESSSSEYESSTLEHIQSSSLSCPSTSSYASTLMSRQNYKGVTSTGIAKKHKKQITTIEIDMQRTSIDDMKHLTNLSVKYNTEGDIVQMYEAGVGKIHRVYDPDELYFDKRTTITRTLTPSELIASKNEFKRMQKNRDDATKHRGAISAKMAMLYAKIAELEDIRQKYQVLTGLSM